MAARAGARPGRDDGLLERWAGLAGATPAAAEAGRVLLSRWREPHRAYHTADHLAAVLDRLDDLAADGEAVDATVEMAAWWHDAVYDVHRSDNEARSADLAAATLAGLGYPPGGVREVARLVRLTSDHRVEGDDAAGSALCDADLAVLASPPPAYARYVAAVRREYGALDDETFRLGRLRVLDQLLGRTGLFSTPTGRRRWESSARDNLQAERRRLQRG